MKKRLQTICSLVSEGRQIADIGTDHAYVPIYLVEKGICPHALAMDVRPGPLSRAQGQIRKHRLEDRITLRESDGLEEMKPGEVDALIIAGMGGQLIRRILMQGEKEGKLAGIQEMILSPQSDLYLFRSYIESSGYSICDERMLKEDGKYYTVMKAIPAEGETQTAYSDAELQYGRYLIRRQDPVFLQYLTLEENKKLQILSNLGEPQTNEQGLRIQEIKQCLKWIEQARNEGKDEE